MATEVERDKSVEARSRSVGSSNDVGDVGADAKASEKEKEETNASYRISGATLWRDDVLFSRRRAIGKEP